MVDVEIERLEVGAGAKGHATGAGEDEHPGVLVGLEVAQTPAKKLGGGVVDGVAPLGPVDRQDRRRADPLVAKLLTHARGILAQASILGFCSKKH